MTESAETVVSQLDWRGWHQFRCLLIECRWIRKVNSEQYSQLPPYSDPKGSNTLVREKRDFEVAGSNIQRKQVVSAEDGEINIVGDGGCQLYVLYLLAAGGEQYVQV